MNNNTEISPAMSIISERSDAVSIIVPLSNSKAGNFVMKTKRCIKCKEVKLLNGFYLSKSGYYNSYCKKCDYKRYRIYNKSKTGMMVEIYTRQLERSKQKGRTNPKYTRIELCQWVFSQPLFHELYDKWVESGYDKWERPSIDRINDYKGYYFGNIQLMTWRENVEKVWKDIANGINNKINKTVLQFDNDGILVKEYYSMSQAARETNINRGNIGSCCRNKRLSSGGYIWKYKNTN